jgi:S-adenosyl methyltransferase
MSTSGIDFTKPNLARVYDVLAGGRDNFAADRDLAGRLLEICPELRGALRENRTFIARAVTWAARQGSASSPTSAPACPHIPLPSRQPVPSSPRRGLVYIDNDPVVTSHVRAMLVTGDGDGVVDANLADPAAVLADPAWRAVIDLAEPVCLVFGLVLGLMPARQAREVVAGYADLVAPGSFVAISCGRCDDEALRKQLSEAYTAADLYNYAPDEVAGFLAGLELVPPGLVAAQSWRGGGHDVPVTPPGPVYVLAGPPRSNSRIVTRE